MLKKIVILFFPILLIAGNLVVDNNSLSQYQIDNYVFFDEFDYHGGFEGYKSDATTDKIVFPSTFPILGNSFTLEAWFYVKDVGGDKTIIGTESSRDESDVNKPPMIILYKSSGIIYGFGTGSEVIMSKIQSVRSNLTWQHVAYTFNGTDSKLYIDGSMVDSSRVAQGKIPIQEPISLIGHRMRGKIDDVRIWNLARTKEQIQSSMNEILNGNEDGLVAYYPMNTNEEWKLKDLTSNNNHASIVNAEIKQRYYSNNCPSPDGSNECPFITIRGALDVAQPGDNIKIMEGRYSELLFRDNLNSPFELNGPTITIEGQNDKVIFDGTVSASANWEPYSHNGHSLLKAKLDMQKISDQAGTKVDSIYGLWVNDRFMIPAMPVNFKNPTDPTTGNPDNPEPGSIWSIEYTAPYDYPLRTMPIYKPGQLGNLDTLEEWSFDPNTQMLYLYPGKETPTEINIRVRVRSNLLHFKNSHNLLFKKIHFYAGAVYFSHSNFISVEDSKFSHSWEVGLRHYELGNFWNWRGNIFHAGNNTTIRNCIFQYVVDGHPFKIQGGLNPTVENVLMQYNDWFVNTTFSPATANNCSPCDKEHWASDNDIGPSTWRYITVNHVRNGGLNPGLRGLMEYIRIENQYMNTDAGAIQRTTGNTIKSTTRYSWILNGNRNGIRFDSWCAGHDGMIHNVISAGQKRGYRLKGDNHNLYHIMGYDSYKHDISLPRIKYCGEHGTAERDSMMTNFDGRDMFNNKGNFRTEIQNSLAGWSFECNSPNCGDPLLTDGNPKSSDPKTLLNNSGIWFGRLYPTDNRILSHATPHLELQDPFVNNRGRSNQQLITMFGENPWENNIQNYDFRPKKGSALIDGGVVIEGINDGTDKDFNHPPSFPGQNRKFIGDAPDIGAYEYGDSVYWIPGYRYSYPSVPIPRDGAKGISMEYGLAWNYPYKKDYSGTIATVTINGPGLSRTVNFNYPKNVLFEEFQPGGTYNWSVTVDGISGGNWTFTVDDKIHPLNDRSLSKGLSDSTLLPFQQKNLILSNNNYAFLRFDIPSSVNRSYRINLNLVPEKVNSLNSGVILYRYDYKGWNESIGSKNIGLVDKTLLTSIDTLMSITEDSLISINMTNSIESNGEISFALGTSIQGDSLSFNSKEKLLKDGIPTDIYLFWAGFAPKTSVWPSLSFTQDSLSVAYDVSLSEGWNLISIPFDGVKSRPKDILGTLINNDQLLYVSSPKGYYSPDDPYSTLGTLSSKDGYYVKVAKSTDKIYFRGKVLADASVSLSAGWNLISYYPDYELNINDAFMDLISSNNLQYVVGFNEGALVYDPNETNSNTLNVLKPTKGYWVKVKQAVTSFSFPSQSKSYGKLAVNHPIKHTELKPTPSFMFLKGKISGKYSEGDIVKVISEDGKRVGSLAITSGGILRNSPVYGDDFTTEEIDGLKAGELLTFIYNGDTLSSEIPFNSMSHRDIELEFEAPLPSSFALHQNYPNPFNPVTTIRYDVPDNGLVRIIIYDLMGRKIKTLVDGVSTPGRYSITWDGTDDFGKPVSSGMYFYRMKSIDFQSVKKLMLLK